MKAALIIFALFSATLAVEEYVEIDNFLIHPDFVFENAWHHQELLGELQDNINEAIFDVQTAVSSVLEGSTGKALTQHEGHINDLLTLRQPLAEAFDKLKDGSCRNSAQTILDSTTEITGFEASNCVTRYSESVDKDIARATAALVKFDDLYGLVQQIVVKSFIGKNKFVNPEDISDTITAMYALVEARWADAKPTMDALKQELSSKINAHQAKLDDCNDYNIETALFGFRFVERQINTCKEFDNTPSPFSTGKKGRAVKFYNFLPEYEEALKNRKTGYEWKD